ncbi:MAG: sll1863 family stress response protein [Planctomycetota bacterium]
MSRPRTTPVARATWPWALALACLLPGACGDAPSASEARRQTAEAWESLKDYGAGQRGEFIRELEALTAALDVQLDNLRARSARAGKEGRAAIEEALADLARQRGDIKRRLEELKATSTEAWGEARDGALDAFRTLRDGVDDAVREL